MLFPLRVWVLYTAGVQSVASPPFSSPHPPSTHVPVVLWINYRNTPIQEKTGSCREARPIKGPSHLKWRRNKKILVSKIRQVLHPQNNRSENRPDLTYIPKKFHQILNQVEDGKKEYCCSEHFVPNDYRISLAGHRKVDLKTGGIPCCFCFVFSQIKC